MTTTLSGIGLRRVESALPCRRAVLDHVFLPARRLDRAVLFPSVYRFGIRVCVKFVPTTIFKCGDGNWFFNDSFIYCVRYVHRTSSVSSAQIADVVSPANRAAAFGILFATFSIGYCVSAGLAPLFSRVHSRFFYVYTFAAA